MNTLILRFIKDSAAAFICGIIIVGLIIILYFYGFGYRDPVFSHTYAARPLTGITYETEDGRRIPIDLPGSLSNIPYRTAVTLYADVKAAPGDCLLVKTVYTPLLLYADDQLIYSCGQEGSYPSFFLDPPTTITTVELPAKEGMQSLRFEYLSPAQRSTMSLPVILTGDAVALFDSVFYTNALSFLFSLLLMLIGLLFFITSLALLPSVSQFSALFWLGLFAAATGVWIFGECNLTAFLLPYPSLLYAMAFVGLFTLAIPLLKFGLIVLNPRYKLPLHILLHILCGACAAAFILQFAGLVNLSRSMYVFHVLIPLSFLVFLAYVIGEAFYFQNKIAFRFLLPIAILTASVILEVINYRLRFTNILSLFFQVGVLILILWLGAIGAHFARDAIHTEGEKKRLELEVTATNRQLALQREQYSRLTDNIEATKKMRHDLRYQFTLLKSYADQEDIKGLQGYLNDLTGVLPIEIEPPLCKNYAVNAISQYYCTLAKSQGIHTEVYLNVPEDTEPALTADLGILFGNLIENAIESCKHLTESIRFIRIKADMKENYLIIAVDNSFDGKWRQKGDLLLSRKRNFKSEGVGLSSVRAIVKKYDGYFEFKMAGTVFKASAMVKIKEPYQIGL